MREIKQALIFTLGICIIVFGASIGMTLLIVKGASAYVVIPGVLAILIPLGIGIGELMTRTVIKNSREDQKRHEQGSSSGR